jgi:hypothetical protein
MKPILLMCALCMLFLAACEKQDAPRTVTTVSKPAPPSPLCGDWQKEAISFGKMEESTGKSDAGLYYFLAARCVHEKAFLLAVGTDTAETISDGATYLCQGEILEFQGKTSGFNEQADQSIAALFKKTAIVEVLRARAGRCPAPKETSN